MSGLPCCSRAPQYHSRVPAVTWKPRCLPPHGHMFCSRPLPTSCPQSSLSIYLLSPCLPHSLLQLCPLRTTRHKLSRKSPPTCSLSISFCLLQPTWVKLKQKPPPLRGAGHSPSFQGAGTLPASLQVLLHLGRHDRVDPCAWDTSRQFWGASLRCRFPVSTLDLLDRTLTRGPGTGFSKEFLPTPAWELLEHWLRV